MTTRPFLRIGGVTLDIETTVKTSAKIHEYKFETNGVLKLIH